VFRSFVQGIISIIIIFYGLEIEYSISFAKTFLAGSHDKDKGIF